MPIDQTKLTPYEKELRTALLRVIVAHPERTVRVKSGIVNDDVTQYELTETYDRRSGDIIYQAHRLQDGRRVLG
jgi:hypothetical protein